MKPAHQLKTDTRAHATNRFANTRLRHKQICPKGSWSTGYTWDGSVGDYVKIPCTLW